MRGRGFLAGLGIVAVCVAVQAAPPVAGNDTGGGKTITIPLTLPSSAKPLELVLIPHGSFTMGSPTSEQGRYPDETQYQVTISRDFYIGKYEVTNAQFRAFRPNHNSKEYNGLTLNEDDQPVVYVSWYDVKAFFEWLNTQCGNAYPGMRFRLPTESEWEYACRAGTETRRYWGDDLNEDQACGYANVRDLTGKDKWDWTSVFNCSDGYGATALVGQFQPNAFGLYDMIGNVWEWCNDWYGPYPSGSAIDPVGPDFGENRMNRGGSWFYYPGYCRSAHRNWNYPTLSDLNVGFRIVLSSWTPQQ
ncbi:MAG TPA: formylglycine-generating enzyme family protein [bacterium]|nr:formylglycine-generating enzyme family protein [bacterium]